MSSTRQVVTPVFPQAFRDQYSWGGGYWGQGYLLPQFRTFDQVAQIWKLNSYTGSGSIIRVTVFRGGDMEIQYSSTAMQNPGILDWGDENCVTKATGTGAPP